MVATILTGAMGTITGYVDTFAGLATATGAEKAAMMKLCMSQSRVILYFALVVAFIQLIFAGISFAIIQRKLKQLSLPAFHIKNIPLVTYFLILTAIPAGIGIIFSLWGIEKIVPLKPEESIPLILGMEYSVLMKVCYFFGIIGVVFAFILLVQTVTNHMKTKRRANI